MLLPGSTSWPVEEFHNDLRDHGIPVVNDKIYKKLQTKVPTRVLSNQLKNTELYSIFAKEVLFIGKCFLDAVFLHDSLF